MKKIILLVVTFFNLFAFNPKIIKSNIIETSHKIGIIDNDNIQKGMTGYVIHNNSIIARALYIGNNKIKYQNFEDLKNEALATPKIFPQKNDEVIFGLYNKKGLIIAPNQDSYITTEKNHPNIDWISSDIFANYFKNKPKPEDFQQFCKDVKVGVIDFILDKEYIVDCKSFYILEENPINYKAIYKNAFFSSFYKYNKSFFGFIPDNWINYYKSIIKKVK